MPRTWSDYTRKPYRFASEPVPARDVAGRHLAWLARTLQAGGFPVNAYTLAACWRHGYEGFVTRARHGEIDYARRVWNLYHSTHPTT